MGEAPFPTIRALVTGASSGIGEAIARDLARRGSDVILVARRVDRLEDLAAQLRSEHKTDVEVLPADLTTEDGLGAVEARLRDSARPVALLVNNAGTAESAPFARIPAEEVDRIVLLNARAATRLTHAALPVIEPAPVGGVIFVSSVLGLGALAEWTPYGATKAFLVSLGESLAQEYRGTDVRVLVSCPGATTTEIWDNAGVDTDRFSFLVPWMTSEEVAVQTLDAWGRGRTMLFVPGRRNRVLVSCVRLLPERWRGPIVEWLLEG